MTTTHSFAIDTPVTIMGRAETRHAESAEEFRREERISRQKAAERLVDIAYALAAGGPLELGGPGERVSVAVADEVLLRRVSTAYGDRVEVLVELSWS